jgi:hypothetical protein
MPSRRANPDRPVRPAYERELGRRRYVALGEDAVILYTEPVLIRRNDRDPDWLAFEAWRKQPGHVVETMAPVTILTG